MTFDIGGHKIEISRARLNYCGVHRFHAAFVARYGRDAPSESVKAFCEAIVRDEAIRLMRRNVGNIANEVGKCLKTPFKVYAEIYSETAGSFLRSVGCRCCDEDEYARMFSPDCREYMQDVVELLVKGVFGDIAQMVDDLDTELQMADSGFASNTDIAERQRDVVERFRSHMQNLFHKFFRRRDVAAAINEAFDKLFWLLLHSLCEAMTLAGEKFACQPIQENEFKSALRACELIEENNIEESKIVPCCLGVLQIAPFLAAAYPPLYARVGDKSGDLARLAGLADVKDFDVLKECILPQLYSRTRLRNLFDIDAFRKDLHAKWAFYAIEGNPEKWGFYVAVKRSVEMIRSTFHRRRLSSQEVADHYRAVYTLLCKSDFMTSQESADKARADVLAFARKMDVPTDWLEPILEAKAKGLEIRLYEGMEKYLKELDLSSEEKAIAARKMVRQVAHKIGYKTFDGFPPLESLIARYDHKARSVNGREFHTREEASVHRSILERIVATDFQSSRECCQRTLDECVGMAAAAGVDADWLVADLRTALRRHDEESRVRMGYLYDTHDEAEAAYREPGLAFRAIWSAVKRFAQKNNWLRSRGSLPSGTLSRLAYRVNFSVDDIFAYYNPAVMTSGQLGLWFCKAGVCICCGSVLAEKLVSLKAISRRMPRKLIAWLESKSPKVFTLPWPAIVAAGSVRVVTSGLEFQGGFVFTCKHKIALAFKALFDELQAFGAKIECDLSQGALEVPLFDVVQGNIQFTDWPSKKKNDVISITLEESDFADRPEELAIPDEPDDYSSSIEMIIEDSMSEAAAHNVKTAQELVISDTEIFTKTPIDGVTISHKDILCIAKESGLLKSKSVAALTDSYLLIVSDGERHAYHFAELSTGVKQSDSGIILSVLRRSSIDTHSVEGGTIHMIGNIELKGSGVEYILGVVDKFLGRTLIFGR